MMSANNLADSEPVPACGQRFFSLKAAPARSINRNSEHDNFRLRCRWCYGTLSIQRERGRTLIARACMFVAPYHYEARHNSTLSRKSCQEYRSRGNRSQNPGVRSQNLLSTVVGHRPGHSSFNLPSGFCLLPSDFWILTSVLLAQVIPILYTLPPVCRGFEAHNH